MTKIGRSNDSDAMTREITRFRRYRVSSRIRGALVENHILQVSGLIYLLYNKIREWSHNTTSHMQEKAEYIAQFHVIQHGK